MLLLIILNFLIVIGRPTDIWYNKIYHVLTPIVEIKTYCGLRNDDVWPRIMLHIHGSPDDNCLAMLEKHSHIYPSASVTVPRNDPLVAIRIIKALKPNNLTISFPNYNQASHFQEQEYANLNSINSSVLQPILNIIEPERILKIVMR